MKRAWWPREPGCVHKCTYAYNIYVCHCCMPTKRTNKNSKIKEENSLCNVFVVIINGRIRAHIFVSPLLQWPGSCWRRGTRRPHEINSAPGKLNTIIAVIMMMMIIVYDTAGKHARQCSNDNCDRVPLTFCSAVITPDRTLNGRGKTPPQAHEGETREGVRSG